MRQGKRLTVLLLVLALGFQLLPASVLAVDASQVQPTTSWVADAGPETMAAPAAVKLSSVKNISSKSIKVTWKKQSGVTGYQVQYSTSSKMKKGKTVTVKKAKATSVTISKLKKGKKYYVRVRAYTKKNGKTKYTAWSGKKSIVFRGRMLTEKEAIAIARTYWKVKPGAVDPENGYELDIFLVGKITKNGRKYYDVYLKWLVEHSWWSTLDRIYIDVYTGDCISAY